MPKSTDLRCYFKCKIDGPLHRFPKYDYPHTEKFERWKSVLDTATQERGNSYIYNSVRFCYRHFKDCYQLPSKRLTLNAVPMLNLNSQESAQGRKNPIEEFLVIHGHNSAANIDSIQTPNCSEEPNIEIPGCNEPNMEIPGCNEPNMEIPGCNEPNMEIPGCNEPNMDIPGCNEPNMDIPVSDEPDIIMELQDSSQSKVELEPISDLPIVPKKRLKEESSSIVIKKMMEKLEKMRKKCKMQSRQIRAAKKSAMCKTLEKLPEASQTFIKLQLKSKNDPRGRRYTDEEKAMALSILKESPKAYEVLQKMFVLPSQRSLQKLGGPSATLNAVNSITNNCQVKE